MKFLFSLTILAFIAPSLSNAQSKSQDCTRLWQLEKEAGCPAAPPEGALTPPPSDKKDYFIQKKTFGPSKCVTRDDVDSAVETLEDKCDKWTEKKENELKKKDRHITGVCNHECAPCPNNSVLQKCTVTGEVQYKINASD